MPQLELEEAVVIFRILNAIMAALFGFAVAVQYNDPDPVRWMLIYGAAGAVCIVAAVRGRVPLRAPLLVGVIALAWAVYWMTDVRDPATYSHMFDSWEMKSIPVEEARESSGLLIVFAWMVVLTVYGRVLRRR